MSQLINELRSLEKAVHTCDKVTHGLKSPRLQPIVLSVGATPTATSIQNIFERYSVGTELRSKAEELKSCIEQLKKKLKFATHASPSPSGGSLSTGDLALTILVEVSSLYSGRESPEALIAAGTLALGREPCIGYDGWGKVSPWNTLDTIPSGWMVGRISQEHGVLAKDPNYEVQAELCVGQKIRIWPNHAW